MYELVQVAENTYYINAPSKIGVYRVSDDVHPVKQKRPGEVEVHRGKNLRTLIAGGVPGGSGCYQHPLPFFHGQILFTNFSDYCNIIFALYFNIYQ